MKYRRIRLFLLLLLPLVAAHALLPTGFMVSFEHGAPVLAFCEGQARVGHHEHHHHPHGENGSSETGRHGSQCPFALAATVAPPIVGDLVVGGAVRVSQPIARKSVSVIALGPVASPPIRGPPRFS